MCDSGKGENFCERSKKEQSARKISRCARNDGMGNGYLVHHAKKECVGNAFFSYRHRKRSPRSFSLAVRGSMFGSEKRETPYRGKTVAVLPIKGLAKGEEKGISCCLK